ncbi:hypothetical protein [Kitasatospora sp. NBC_01266]|uniref:hypothetical protein n=1 Tax=Kitasatospora sp. NBC_01266 TaxID=2903572 RepID=UPI002E3585B5|nr:hypothetical protein [Kitasatospora sp. NBC_01266]
MVSTDLPYTGLSTRGHIELFHGGSFAGTPNASHPDTVRQVRYLVQSRLERAIHDLVTVAALHARRQHADGLLQIRATIQAPEHGHNAKEIALTHQFHNARASTPEPVADSIALRWIAPVTGEGPLVDLVSSNDARNRLTRQLALDLVHQFAVPSVRTL